MSKTDSTSKSKFKFPSFTVQIIAALILGIFLGWVALTMGTVNGKPNWLTITLKTIGSSFVTLLKALVPPLIFLAIVSSIANLRGVANGARLAFKTLIWFAITAFIAVSIGITLGLVLQPGVNATVSQSAAKVPSHTGSWLDFLQGLIPGNYLGLEASSSATPGAISTYINFNALQILIIALVIGVAALKTGEKAEPFLAFSSSMLAVLQRVLWWIIRLAPIGTLGLIGNAVASYGWAKVASLGWFALAIYLGLIIVLFGVYPLLLKIHGLAIMDYYKGAWPAIWLAFVSRSSLGVLPVTEQVTTRNLGVPESYASFAVPLGATTKMDGCASIYPAVSAIFVAQFFGVKLTIFHYLLIIFVAVLGSAATAGVTGATVMLTLTLSTLGLPLEGVGLLLAIDPILDMGRTAVNVAGQALVPVIVAKREKILDQSRYEGSNIKDLFSENTSSNSKLATAKS